jgi:hypothetical protein
MASLTVVFVVVSGLTAVVSWSTNRVTIKVTKITKKRTGGDFELKNGV